MNVDEIIADPREALSLEPTQILVNVIVMGEYIDCAPDGERPERRRLAMITSDELEPWTTIGILRFAQMRGNDAISWADEDEDEE